MSFVPTVRKSDRSVVDKMLPLDDNDALSVAEGNVYSLVLTPFPRINMSSVFSSADVL